MKISKKNIMFLSLTLSPLISAQIISAQITSQLSEEVRTLLFHEAVAESNIQNIQHLLDKGVDINAKNNNGETPLHIAVCKERPEVVTLLLKNGADVNAKDDLYGFTPLHITLRNNNLNLTKLLLDKNANINAKDKSGALYPLYFAISHNNIPIAKILLDRFADPNIKVGTNAPMLKDILKRKQETNINFIVNPNKFFFTPLLISSYKKNYAMVNLLLKNGADPTLVRTLNKDNKDIVKLLEKANENHVNLKTALENLEKGEKTIETIDNLLLNQNTPVFSKVETIAKLIERQIKNNEKYNIKEYIKQVPFNLTSLRKTPILDFALKNQALDNRRMKIEDAFCLLPTSEAVLPSSESIPFIFTAPDKKYYGFLRKLLEQAKTLDKKHFARKVLNYMDIVAILSKPLPSEIVKENIIKFASPDDLPRTNLCTIS